MVPRPAGLGAGNDPARLTGRAGAVIAGLLSGVLNASSGVNGPPIAVYAAAQPWSTRELVATVQAVFLPTNVAAFIVLQSVPLAPAVLGAGVAGTLAGLIAGTFLRDRVPAAAVRIGVLVVTAVRAIIILVQAFR
jgi:uncharacterized protein